MDHDPVKKEFLQAMRGITSTVTIVSAKDGKNKQAMTATSVTSLSLDPPTMLVCINHEASIHELINEGLGFCINILSLGQKNLADICSLKGKEEERFLEGNWSELENIPYNIDSQSNIFCNSDQLPLEIASNPKLPVPANISKHLEFLMSFVNQLKMVSLVLLVVGLMYLEALNGIFNPLNFPATILTLETLFLMLK